METFVTLLFSLLLSLTSYSQKEEQALDVSMVLKDSSYNIQCYYTDIEGNRHFYDKIIYCKLKGEKNYNYHTWKGDSMMQLDENAWSSIGYYTLYEDTTFYRQQVRADIGKPNVFIVTKSYIKNRFWLGQDVSNRKQAEKSLKRAFKRSIVYTADKEGSVMIWSFPSSGGRSSFNSYNGPTPGNASAPLYSGSGASVARTGGTGGYDIFKLVIGDSVKSLTDHIYVDAEKNILPAFEKFYDRILRALESNPELLSMFKYELAKAINEGVEEQLNKKSKRWIRIEIMDIWMKLLDQYQSEHLIEFGKD